MSRRIPWRCRIWGHQYKPISVRTLGYGDLVHGIKCKRCGHEVVTEVVRDG